MSNKTTMSRRKFTVAAASIGITSIAGCSSDEGTGTTTSGSTDTQTSTSTSTGTTDAPETTEEPTTTETAEDVPTADGEPSDKVSDGVIETLADYEYVAERPDQFIGTEITSDGGNGEISYYNEYEDYAAFRALFKEATRPFLIKTDKSFLSGDEIKFTGTVEKIETMSGVPVIFVENATIEKIEK